MDDYTYNRSYIKLTCQRTINKQDHAQLLIPSELIKWPSLDSEYQYLMQNILLEQSIDQKSGEVMIESVGLRIADLDAKSDFLAAEQMRRQGQNFIVSVFRYPKGVMVEAINIDRPHQRAYLLNPVALEGLLGKQLQEHLEKHLVMNFDGRRAIQSIEFE